MKNDSLILRFYKFFYRTGKGINKRQTLMLKKVKVKFWLSLENIDMCTVIRQLLLCGNLT